MHVIIILIIVFVIGAIVLGYPPLRCKLITPLVMYLISKVLPKLGDTERIALEAGTVWWDGDLFSGNPDWGKLLAYSKPRLTQKELNFLNTEVEELCQKINEWEIQNLNDLPPEIWTFLKAKGFFGIIIPTVYGGLEMSALAHSAIVTKIASRSLATAVTVMVPNSIGPAELLLHYGTQKQKDYYLPRLARGEEIPCFSLTEHEAGSDASSIKSSGIICYDMYEDQRVLGIRLNWKKRYITLSPVATVLGLAFVLYDPDHLLGKQEDLGITCALVPARLSGVTIGLRHDPMGVPFQNGPTEGRNVFIPIDFIIGGKDMAGQGWKMLMESLAAGRAISLPALAIAAMEGSTRVVSAYGLVREQFSTPIGKFEGIEERMARIAGFTYVMNAARIMTAGAIDKGAKPAVISAIAKAYLTETMRSVVCDALDILGGAGICRGPRNTLEPAFRALPIGITVEGANILTRSLIIYGQGAIRCHPFAHQEMIAVAEKDLEAFDEAFFGHIKFVIKNKFWAFVHALTRGVFVKVPKDTRVEKYFRRLTRMSSAFAYLSDVAMITLGAKLKKNERLSGRFADALAWMYLTSSALRRFIDEGQKPEHLPYIRWACEHGLFCIQNALASAIDNFPVRLLRWPLSFVIFPLGRHYREPGDKLIVQIASQIILDPALRDSLTSDIFIPSGEELGAGKLDLAFHKVVAALPVTRKLRLAVKKGILSRKVYGKELFDNALAKGVITDEEFTLILEADALRQEVIQVDAF